MQKGLALYLSVIIMTIMLAIALGTSSIFLGQLDVMRGLGYSVIAFYAADAGMEKALMQRAAPFLLDGYSATLSNGASYAISVISPGSGGCTASNYCIKSIGSYKKTNRAIEISY